MAKKQSHKQIQISSIHNAEPPRKYIYACEGCHWATKLGDNKATCVRVCCPKLIRVIKYK